MPSGLVYALIVVMAFSTVVFDILQRSNSRAAVWPLFVLFADLSLVLRLGKRFATSMIVAVTMWIVLSSAEDNWRFGMWDLPGTDPQWLRQERISKRYICDKPPCPALHLAALQDMILSLTILLLDFIATRGFAYQVEREQSAMLRTIDTVEAIAQLLAGYDVDTVAERLREAEGSLPPAMHAALHSLEQNLRTYRPYLPKTCLPRMSDDSSDVENPRTPSRSISDPLAGSVQSARMKPLYTLQSLRVTVLVLNACDTIAHATDNMRSFCEHFDSLLSATLTAVEHHRGMVDVFFGDRVLASFNASRPCATHAPSAVSASKRIAERLPQEALGSSISIGLASGHVVCGDLGCPEMRRFSLIGSVCLVACGMERAARAFGFHLLCDVAVRNEAEHNHSLLLVPRLVRLVKVSAGSGPDCLSLAVEGLCQGDHPVYRLCDSSPEPEDVKGTVGDEWLYEVEKHGQRWADYNAAMKAYIGGATAAEALQLAAGHKVAVADAIRSFGRQTPLTLQF